MHRNARLESLTIEELWVMHEELSEILKEKINAEKEELERRLRSLNPAVNHVRARRPYPPVLPKFANPDQPRQVWSGRGKQPRWIKQKLGAGLTLQELSIAGVDRPNMASA